MSFLPGVLVRKVGFIEHTLQIIMALLGRKVTIREKLTTSPQDTASVARNTFMTTVLAISK